MKSELKNTNFEEIYGAGGGEGYYIIKIESIRILYKNKN